MCLRDSGYSSTTALPEHRQKVISIRTLVHNSHKSYFYSNLLNRILTRIEYTGRMCKIGLFQIVFYNIKWSVNCHTRTTVVQLMFGLNFRNSKILQNFTEKLF